MTRESITPKIAFLRGERFQSTADLTGDVRPQGDELELIEAVELAAEKNRLTLEDRAGEHPNKRGYLGPAWTFACELKGHSRLTDLDADAAIETLMPIMEELAREKADQGSPKGAAAWVELLGDIDTFEKEDDPLEHFWSNWDQITPTPSNPVAEALRWADENPIHRPGLPEAFPDYKRFLSLCVWLARVMRSPRIYIPVHKWGHVLGCTAVSIGRYRTRAVAEGYIHLVKKGSRGSAVRPGEARRADEFEIDVGAFKIGLAPQSAPDLDPEKDQ